MFENNTLTLLIISSIFDDFAFKYEEVNDLLIDDWFLCMINYIFQPNQNKIKQPTRLN